MVLGTICARARCQTKEATQIGRTSTAMTANGIKRRRKLSQTFAQPPKSTKTALSRANMPALAGWAKTRWCPVSTPSGIESCTCQKRARAAGWCAFETAWMQWLNAASTKRTRLCSPPSQAGKTGSSFPQTSTIARVISPWMIAMSSNAASVPTAPFLHPGLKPSTPRFELVLGTPSISGGRLLKAPRLLPANPVGKTTPKP
mmetsp:Transcript_14161/g.22511  ORF Transcript_14161/g.22511 Transcript_14161/m.22511 type:complete len:202 (+) Transcript_14161:295-900(+)